MVDMCQPCQSRACGSCTESGCECFRVFQAWQEYHRVTIRPVRVRHDAWEASTAETPPHHAYTGRHERNLNFRLDRAGRRVRISEPPRPTAAPPAAIADHREP